MAYIEVNCYSAVLEMCVHFGVILPQRNTDGQIGMESRGAEKYPVLYLLHGLSDDETIWMRRTSIERYATEKGMAVVMPCTFRGWYLDTPFAKYYTYIGKELPELVAEFFPSISTSPADTYIAGLSMGGYGTLHFALTMPERYAAAACLSGALDLTRKWELNIHSILKQDGVLLTDPTGTDADVYHLARGLGQKGNNRLPIYIWCGTEDEFITDNRRMRDTLLDAGFPVQYSEYAGDHGWNYWDEQIEKVLDWIGDLRK